MKVPVAAYSVVITIMGIAAFTTSLPSLLAPLGAALFIASDVVLSVEKFKTKFWRAKTINWLLYAERADIAGYGRCWGGLSECFGVLLVIVLITQSSYKCTWNNQRQDPKQ